MPRWRAGVSAAAVVRYVRQTSRPATERFDCTDS
jgi:hypothetical protein